MSYTSHLGRTGIGRPCSVCSHPDRHEIDRAIISGELPASISKRFSKVAPVNDQAIRRHAQTHLPTGAAAEAVKATAAQAMTEAEKARATDLVLTSRQLLGKAIAILQKAESAGDLKTALAGVREAARCTELMGKLMGDITETHVTNVLVAPQFVSVQTLILEALERHPEARADVIRALENIH